MEIAESTVRALLGDLVDSNTGKTFNEAKAITAVQIQGRDVVVSVQLGYPAKKASQGVGERLQKVLAGLPGIGLPQVNVSWKVVSHAVQGGLRPLPGIRNIIAVASGKGGVGKSTTAVNLALALQDEGAKVGLLDADIYGPSQPMMLGTEEHPKSLDGKTMEPVMAHGLQTMSVGYLVNNDTPMVWRGPMVTQALQQLLNETRWQDLDYLVIDLPPGTGDIQLTLAQKVPVTGAVIVTTPQDIALLDARKGLKMFEKVSVPILGIIENMSTHVCSQCGHEEHIFGEGGAAKMCADCNTELLGELPLDIRIREHTDAGAPTVVAAPDSALSEAYRSIARKVAARIALQGVDHSAKFPKIVIKNA